jgi:hypothetical protein
VPTERVFDTARKRDAIPYDIPGAEPFSHGRREVQLRRVPEGL